MKQYSTGVYAVHRNRPKPEVIAELGHITEVDEVRVVGKGCRVVDKKKVEVLLFQDGRWDVSECWKRTPRARSERARRKIDIVKTKTTTATDTARATSVVEQTESQTEAQTRFLPKQRLIVRPTGKLDQSSGKEETEDGRSASLPGSISLPSDLDAPQKVAAHPDRMVIRGGADRPDGLSSRIRLALSRIAAPSNKPLSRGESLGKSPNDEVSGVSEGDRPGDRQMWPSLAEAACAQEWIHVGPASAAQQRETSLETQSQVTLWQNFRNRPNVSEVIVDETYDQLREQEASRLGYGAGEESEKLNVLNAIRRRAVQARSEGKMDAELAAAIMVKVQGKMNEARTSASAEEEDWNLVQDQDPKAVAAMNDNKLRL